MGDGISRRAALRRCALGTLVLGAGCQALESDGAGPGSTTTTTGSQSTTRTPTTTGTTETPPSPPTRPPSTTVPDPPPDATRRVTVESVRERPDLDDVAAWVEVVEPFATPDHPPTIRATVANAGLRRVEMHAYHAAVLWPQYSEERDPGLSVDPGTDRPETGDCWRARWTITVVSTHRTVTVAPGDSRSADLVVLGQPENDGPCLPTGTYRFVDDFPSVCSPDGDCRDWGIEFSLRVEATD